MSRFSAVTLDLSRFPAPLAIRGIDYEALLAERKARLLALFDDAGVVYDVAALETDPAIIVEETDAYRELLAYAAINDAVRACMVAFAVGADLDHLAAIHGLVRRIITPASGSAAAVMESDAEFRRRVLLAPEAFSTGGPAGAYLYQALTADPRVLNADVWSPKPGQVKIAVQSREGDGTASNDLVEAVRRWVCDPVRKPLTDDVSVGSITNHRYSAVVTAYILPGPDPMAVRTEIETAVLAEAARRRTPARDMPRSALIAAAHLPVVDKVILAEPTVDLARGYGEVAVMEALTVKVVTYDG